MPPAMLRQKLYCGAGGGAGDVGAGEVAEREGEAGDGDDGPAGAE